MNGAECGTYAAYQQHRANGEIPCAACRRANAVYKRRYRRRPEVRDVEARENAARSRALWRLARLHPAQFQILYREELLGDRMPGR